MKIVVQRVQKAEITVGGLKVAAVDQGLLLFVGFLREDGGPEFEYLTEKILHLRIFADEVGKMNRSVQDIQGEVLLVPNFTLYGDCRKGRRPSFDRSSPPELAQKQYETFLKVFQKRFSRVKSGIFQAHMEVALVNDGPVTFILEYEKRS